MKEKSEEKFGGGLKWDLYNTTLYFFPCPYGCSEQNGFSLLMALAVF